ncbi:hypothetical protein GOP47_0011549 [Adiantum capillus-veneris]|uniref:Uncharacterized protein n=1 Tax=Adiantum capillus-veneris TaxID=13818 RepID=A0A9D4UT61_ADICA|nr:hypothetical protein GOP47_0011549 [Adiantum capillus-veneris]
MQQEQKQTDHKDWKIDAPLWEVICSTVLANPAEQSVVQQVVGETLIQESASLHREALALHNIISAVKGNRDVDETLGNATKRGQVEDNLAVCANPPAHPYRSIRSKDDREHAPYTKLSERMDKDRRLQSRPGGIGLSKLLKTSERDANVPLHQGKAKRDNNGMLRLDKARKSIANGDMTHRMSTKENALSPPQRSVMSSSFSSSSADKTQSSIKGSCMPADQIVEISANDIPSSSDYMGFLTEKGEKINAYDIDEVLHELRDAFATEQVYLNQLVEELRRALEDCIDSYPMAHNKAQEIKGQGKVSNRVELSKFDISQAKDVGQVSQRPPSSESSSVMRTSKGVGQIPQRSPSPSSKRSLVPIVKNTKLEKAASKPTLCQLPKHTNKVTERKPTERPPLKHVGATIKSPNLPSRERRRFMS